MARLGTDVLSRSVDPDAAYHRGIGIDAASRRAAIREIAALDGEA
jgi:hypothetical protein